MLGFLCEIVYIEEQVVVDRHKTHTRFMMFTFLPLLSIFYYKYVKKSCLLSDIQLCFCFKQVNCTGPGKKPLWFGLYMSVQSLGQDP